MVFGSSLMSRTAPCCCGRFPWNRVSRSYPHGRSRSVGFTGFQHDLAIHPAGYAVALYIVTCTLQVLKIGTQTDDAVAPAASLYGGQGTRPGLLSNPAAIACSLDKILVLQTTPQYPAGLHRRVRLQRKSGELLRFRVAHAAA